MSAIKKGIATSLFFHAIIFFSFFVLSDLLEGRQKPIQLDFRFSYSVKPKGNTLEKSAPKIVREIEENNRLALKDTSSPSSSPLKPMEKKYGVADGAEGAEDFYIKEHFGEITGKIGNILLYPPLARKNGWEGRVVVTFCICPTGEIVDVKVKKSSGYPVLDSSAVKTIQSITGVPKPATITRLTVPISYSLD